MVTLLVTLQEQPSLHPPPPPTTHHPPPYHAPSPSYRYVCSDAEVWVRILFQDYYCDRI